MFRGKAVKLGQTELGCRVLSRSETHSRVEDDHMLAGLRLEVDPGRRNRERRRNLNRFEMNLPRFRPVLFFEFGDGKISDGNFHIAERVRHPLELFFCGFRLLARLEIERMRKFFRFRIAPGTEVVTERGEQFRNDFTVFGEIGETEAVENVFHKCRPLFYAVYCTMFQRNFKEKSLQTAIKKRGRGNFQSFKSSIPEKLFQSFTKYGGKYFIKYFTKIVDILKMRCILKSQQRNRQGG